MREFSYFSPPLSSPAFYFLLEMLFNSRRYETVGKAWNCRQKTEAQKIYTTISSIFFCPNLFFLSGSNTCCVRLGTLNPTELRLWGWDFSAFLSQCFSLREHLQSLSSWSFKLLFYFLLVFYLLLSLSVNFSFQILYFSIIGVWFLIVSVSLVTAHLFIHCVHLLFKFFNTFISLFKKIFWLLIPTFLISGCLYDWFFFSLVIPYSWTL